MVLQATKAAVSVRNRFEPKRTVVKPYSLASAISWGVKSPSGPINTRVSVFLLQTCCNKGVGPSSSPQWAMNFWVSLAVLINVCSDVSE